MFCDIASVHSFFLVFVYKDATYLACSVLHFLCCSYLCLFFNWRVIAFHFVLVSAAQKCEWIIIIYMYPLPLEPPSLPPWFLVFKGNFILFFKVVASIYISTNSIRGFPFPHYVSIITLSFIHSSIDEQLDCFYILYRGAHIFPIFFLHVLDKSQMNEITGSVVDLFLIF